MFMWPSKQLSYFEINLEVYNSQYFSLTWFSELRFKFWVTVAFSAKKLCSDTLYMFLDICPNSKLLLVIGKLCDPFNDFSKCVYTFSFQSTTGAQCFISHDLSHSLNTLFNFVEAPFKRLLYFDVYVVWWCSGGPINSQEYKSLKFMRSLSRYLWLNITTE